MRPCKEHAFDVWAFNPFDWSGLWNIVTQLTDQRATLHFYATSPVAA